MSIYPDNYHREIDPRLHAPYPATEMITEIDVHGGRLQDFWTKRERISARMEQN
jgi:hypothetical protein